MIITLLTDFGLSDPYVGIMKGVILGICPDATLVDLAHEVPAQDIRCATFMLDSAFRYFPERTIHCVVVDPGVGTDRSILIVRACSRIFIAPDNGVLAGVFASCPNPEVWQAANRACMLPDIGHTFHGRDIFAPVAGYLARGVPPEKIGIPAQNYIRGEMSLAKKDGDHITGEIVHIDRFGNAITNIHRSMLPENSGVELEIGNCCIRGLVSSYAEAETGEPLILIGSHDTLEISVREGSAKAFFDLQTGDRIIVRTPANRSGGSSRISQ